jgi:RNA polymerase sigma factor (sigma-70 family)
MNRSLKEDRELLSKCVSGDRTASETLVRSFSDLVYRSVQYTLMAKHVSFNRHDLEDLHNTVFLRLFEQGCKKLRQYQGKNGCSLASWIRMITVRTVLDHLRKKGVDAMVWQKRRVPLEEVPELRASGVEPGAQIEKAQQERLLQEGMERLPPRDRLFMKLHFDQGLSMTEVAEAMQLSAGAAYTVKHRAIQRLKSHLASATNYASHA